MLLKGDHIEEIFPVFSPNTSVLQLLLEALKKNGNNMAQVDSQSGKLVSFRDVLQQSSAITTFLRNSAGVTAGVNVVLCCDKSIEAYLVQLGVMFTGATAVLVNTQAASDIHQYVRGHTIKVVVCDPSYLNSVSQSVSQLSPAPTVVITIDKLIASLSNTSEEISVFNVQDNSKHIPLILFTSGSTGDPKGVQISDLGLQRHGFSFDDGLVERYLLISSFSWISSTISLISSILKNYCLILSNSKDPKTHLELIQKYKVNGVTVHATSVNHYIKVPCLSSMDLSSLTLVIIGGEVLLERVVRSFIKEVLKGRIGVQSLYGMTETGIVTTWRNFNLLDLSKTNSSGYLAPGVEIKILDETGNHVAPGSVGELWVKTISLMIGYWGKLEFNHSLFDEHGFFKTGDAGYCDGDGFLYLCGRISDLVNYKGTQVSVSDIEDILKSHPGIFEAAVVGKPNEKDIFHLAAFIVKDPHYNLTEEEVLKFVEGQVEDYKKLRGGVYFLNNIPKNSSGKIQRGLLQKTFSESSTLY